MNGGEQFDQRGWVQKFRDALRGMKEGVRGQSSFFVHLFTAAAVIVSAVMLHMNRVEWCLLLLCITAVLVAEMFNSALEAMARAVGERPDPHLGTALDIGSAAVLLAAIGAAVVGTVVFGHRVASLLGWW